MISLRYISVARANPIGANPIGMCVVARPKAAPLEIGPEVIHESLPTEEKSKEPLRAKEKPEEKPALPASPQKKSDEKPVVMTSTPSAVCWMIQPY